MGSVYHGTQFPPEAPTSGDLKGESVCRLCKDDVEDSEHLFSSCVGLRSERFNILHHHRLPNPLEWEPTELSRFLRIPTVVDLMCSPGEE